MTRFQPTTDPQPTSGQVLSDWARERHRANHARMEQKYGARFGLVKPEPEPEPAPAASAAVSEPATPAVPSVDTRTLEEIVADLELELAAAQYRLDVSKENQS